MYTEFERGKNPIIGDLVSYNRHQLLGPYVLVRLELTVTLELQGDCRVCFQKQLNAMHGTKF